MQVQQHGKQLKIMIEWDLPQECKMWLIYENPTQCVKDTSHIDYLDICWKTQQNSAYIHEKIDVKLDVKGMQIWDQHIWQTHSSSYSKWKANSFIYNSETK